MASSGSRSAAVRKAWLTRTRGGASHVLTGGSMIKGSAKRGALARTLRIDRALLAGKAARPTGRLGSIQAANKYLLQRGRLAATVKTSRDSYHKSGFSVRGTTASLTDHGKQFTARIKGT